MAALISNELAEFLEAGISIQVGTRDERFFPDSVRAVGARVDARAGEVVVFVPHATSATSLANLRGNGRIAICFARPSDHRTMQLKGQVLEIRDMRDDERPSAERYLGALADDLGYIGVPPRIVLRINRQPCFAVRVRVESIFVQTPGPGAGAPLGTPSGATR